MIAFINNDFLDEKDAVLHVGDLALQRGYAAFDFLRTRNGIPLFVDDYLDRFFNSASLMHLQPRHSKEQIRKIIYELLERNGMPDAGIRMILTGGYSPDSYEPVQPNLVVLQHSLKLPTTEKFSKGIKVITHEYMRDLPSVKSINYLMGIWLQQKVRDQGAQDVLYHINGIVTEFPRANVFIVTKEGRIITPSQNILKGITRLKLLELMKGKFEVEQRPLHLDEVKDAAEVFMTSTTKRLLPVCQVDEAIIGIGIAGPVATQLNQEFMLMENQWLDDTLIGSFIL